VIQHISTIPTTKPYRKKKLLPILGNKCRLGFYLPFSGNELIVISA
jgi:hypothetical protein